MLYLWLFVQLILILIFIFAIIQFYDVVFRGLAPFISTSFRAILIIIKELNLTGKEKVYELGSGKAGFLRAVEEKFGNIELVGIEKSPWPCFISKFQIAFSHSRIKVICKDLFKVNLKEADVIYCFLNVKMMASLENKIKKECRPGTLIISYCFSLKSMEPEKILKDGLNNIYFYRV